MAEYANVPCEDGETDASFQTFDEENSNHAENFENGIQSEMFTTEELRTLRKMKKGDAIPLLKIMIKKVRKVSWTEELVEKLPKRESLLQEIAKCVLKDLDKDESRKRPGSGKSSGTLAHMPVSTNSSEGLAATSVRKKRAIKTFLKLWHGEEETQRNSRDSKFQQYRMYATLITMRLWLEKIAEAFFIRLGKPINSNVTIGMVFDTLNHYLRVQNGKETSTLNDNEEVAIKDILNKVPYEYWKSLRKLNQRNNKEIHKRDIPVDENGRFYIIYANVSYPDDLEQIMNAIEKVSQELLDGIQIFVKFQSDAPCSP